jgi:plastocyanin
MMYKMLHNTPKLKIKTKKHRVKIHDHSFEPSNIKIERGEIVEWTLHFKTN